MTRLPLYINSERVIAPSLSSRLFEPATWRQRQSEKKVGNYTTVHGTLDAERVVGKLRASCINKETIFLTWAMLWRHFEHYAKPRRQDGEDPVEHRQKNGLVWITIVVA